MGVTILTSIEGCKKLCHKSTIQYIMEPRIVLLAFLTYSVGMILISDHKH